MHNDRYSHGLWEKTAPPAPETQRLSGDHHADVVVVGAGFTGLSTALHVAEAGFSVVVVEAAGIGFGGSGRNVGLVNAGLWVMPEILPAMLGPGHGKRLLDLLAAAPDVVYDLVEKHGMDCEAVHAGTLHCAADQAGLISLRERERQWQARGAPVRLLDRDEAASRLGTADYLGALLDERAGTIQPLAYARGLAHAAAKAGARIFTGSPVTGAARHGAAWRVATAGGNVTSDWVVVATNAYTRGPWQQQVRDEIVRLPFFNFATPPLPDDTRARILPGGEGAWDTRKILSAFRLDRQGRLLFGSFGALDGTGFAVHAAWARRSLKRLFPFLSGIEFETAWYGQIGMTDDAMPRFHRFDRNVVGISGYNGRGIAPGTVFGRCLAELVTGRIAERDLPLPLTEPRAQGFRSAREGFYALGAQLAHLAGARI